MILQWRRDSYETYRYKYDWMSVMKKIASSVVIEGYGMSMTCYIGELRNNQKEWEITREYVYMNTSVYIYTHIKICIVVNALRWLIKKSHLQALELLLSCRYSQIAYKILKSWINECYLYITAIIWLLTARKWQCSLSTYS